MAKGTIEQTIALKITGVEDVEKIDKKIAALEKKKHELEVGVDTGDADKKIDRIDKKIAVLEDKKVEAQITVDVNKALASTQDVFDNLSKFDKTTATAVLAIKAAEVTQALSEVHGQLADIDGTSVDVEVRADQAKALTDQFNTIDSKIQELNATPVVIPTEGAAEGVRKIGEGADSAKTALSGFAGSAAEGLGEMVGVTDEAGRAVGQLAENFADTALEARKMGKGFSEVLTSFATTAVPIAAATVGIALLSKAWDSYQETQKKIAERNKATADSLEEQLGITERLAPKVDETATAWEHFVAALDSEGIGKAITSLGEVHKTVADLDDIIKGLTLDKLGTIGELLKSANVDPDLIPKLTEIIGKYDDWKDVEFKLHQQFKGNAEERALSFKPQIHAIAELIDQQENLINDDVAKQFLLQSAAADESSAAIVANAIAAHTAADGQIDWKAAMVAASIDLGNQNQIVEEATKIIKDWATKTVEAVAEHNKAVDAAIQKAIAIRDAWINGVIAMGTLKDSADQMATSFDQLNKASELDFATTAFDTVNAFDDIKEALKDAEKAGVDWSNVDLSPDSVAELKGIPPELQKLTQSVVGMRTSIQAELKNAFDTGGVQAFADKAAFFRGEIEDQFLPIFTKLTGNAETAKAMVAQLEHEIGILPADKEVEIRLTRIEQAQRALDNFSGFIDQLSQGKQIEIRTHMAEGDIQGALDLLNTELVKRGFPPIVLPVDADITKMGQTVAEATDGIADLPPALVPVDANTAPLEASVADIAAFLGTTEIPPFVLDADTAKADAARTLYIDNANAADAQIALDADPTNAIKAQNLWIANANAAKAKATFDADSELATAAKDVWVRQANAAQAQADFDADPTNAEAAQNLWIANANLAEATAHLTAVVDDQQANADLAALTKPRTVTIKASFTGGPQQSGAKGFTSSPPGGIAGEAGPEFIKRPGHPEELLTYPSYIPTGTRVTSVRRTRAILARHGRTLPRYASGTGTDLVVRTPININVNTAVVGNRFDVARAVGRGTRDLQRLVGTRG